MKCLFANGCVYAVANGNLLYHASMPLNADGTLKDINIQGELYHGKALLKKVGALIRSAYFGDADPEVYNFALDYIWYLWCGKDSPTYFVDKKGMNPYIGRMRAMLIFACFPLLGLIAQPMGEYSAWWPAIIIGLLGAGHQAWSANLYSTIGDMFPKSTVATITGIGAMAGGIGSFLINKGSGMLFTYAEGQGSAFTFMGFDGKPGAYMIVFCICSVAYLVGWCIMKALVPKYKPIVVE